MTKLAYLKIKNISLSDEARKIHLAERKYKSHGPLKECDTGDKRSDTFWGLRAHRIFKVRPDARCAQLAWGFLTGMPYKRIEKKARSEPNWTKIQILAGRFGREHWADMKHNLSIDQAFSQWRNAG